MRKVIYGINLTADGCCDHTKGNAARDIHSYFTRLFDDVDLLVYGRKTYELMVPYWPDVARTRSADAVSNEFAVAFDAIPKIVFSTTLENADEKTTIVRGNLAEEFLRLKQLPGKSISVGGVDLPSQLIALGLVDEFHFVIHSKIAGAGRRLLDSTHLADGVDLKLLEAKALPSGAVAMRYEKA